MPQDSSMEKIILGSILFYGDCEGLQDPSPFDFQDMRHRAIMQVIMELKDMGDSCSVDNVKKRLKDKGIDIGLKYVDSLLEYKVNDQTWHKTLKKKLGP